MFIKQKNNAIFKVSLTLDKVLTPYWNLSKYLLGDALLSERDYSVYDRDFEKEKAARIDSCEKAYEQLCQEIDAKDISAEEKENWKIEEGKIKFDGIFLEAFKCIHRHYLKQVLSPECFSKRISKSCSLIVYKEEQEECLFFTEDGADSKFDKEFVGCLSSMHVVEDFIKFLNGGIGEDYGFNPKIYSNALPNYVDYDTIAISSPLYNMEFIEVREGTVRQPSDYLIWYNKACLKSLDYDEPQAGDRYEYRVGERLIGLEQGQYFIPMVSDWQPYFTINNESRLLWTDYKNKLYNNKVKEDDHNPRPARSNTMSAAEQNFVNTAVAHEDFTNLLSHLTDNLYLSDGTQPIPEAYHMFFDQLIKIEDLKHLPDYKLYVPKQEEDGTILGVYKIHRLAGETAYNLRHMLYSERNGERMVYKDYSDGKRNVATVQVLKPQYASFYMMDYYEFFVEEVLKALKQDGVIKDYLRNQKYSYRGQGGNKEIEIDALVYNGQKIYLLELKTTMHIEFLNIYPQRYAAVLADEEKPELYEFHLISSFADDNIAILKYEEDNGYNVRREGLKSVPYKFNVAIPVREGAQAQDLHCLSESSFNRLKTELTKVFIV